MPLPNQTPHSFLITIHDKLTLTNERTQQPAYSYRNGVFCTQNGQIKKIYTIWVSRI